MITFLSATPGSGKSLLSSEKIYILSKDNIKNLKHNFYYAKAFFEKIENLGLNSYLRSVTINKGQGLERETEYLFLDAKYFDFLKTEYKIQLVISEHSDLDINFPEYYYERIAILNLIIDTINEKEKTDFEHFKPVRTIYTNIADLRLSQARPLPADCDWRKTPQGSFFFIDEAQLIPIFSEEAKKLDPIVHDLTIHRHKGYDFFFITQDPSFVNKYIRKLASLHIHLVNIFGWEQSMKIEWTVVQENPNAVRSISRAENITRWRFPKHIYKLYKSSTIHTRKKRIPKKLVILSVLGISFFLGAGLLFSEDSALLRFLSGKSPLELKADEKSSVKSSDQKSDVKLNQSSVNSESAVKSDQDSEVQKSNESLGSVSDASAAVPAESVKSSDPVYDPADPFAFVPQSKPNVVNHRIFSGCVSYSGKHFAVDQQGTLIKQFSASDCKKLLAHSYNRPFDYFGNRQQSLQQSQTADDSDVNYKKLLMEFLLEQEAQKKEKAKNAQVVSENVSYNQPTAKYIDDATNKHTFANSGTN